MHSDYRVPVVALMRAPSKSLLDCEQSHTVLPVVFRRPVKAVFLSPFKSTSQRDAGLEGG